jgi:magnesium-transporting ATPase (P-type)
MRKLNDYIKFWSLGIMAASIFVYGVRLLLHSSRTVMESSLIIIVIISIVAVYRLTITKID